jgi:ABC-type transport system involved in multi-copper enzyme maturation permease subunit
MNHEVNVLVRIIKKQFLEYLMSLRFLVGLVLCLAIGVGATIVRTNAYGVALADYRVNRVDHSNEVKSYTSPFPLTYSGVSLDKKPAVLGIFYRGLESTRPMSVRVTANRDPRTEDQFEHANLVADLFETVDLMSFVSLVMGLLALVFSYDLVSGEKEAGTLRLSLSFPIPRDYLLIGKWIGGYLALAAPLVLTASCSLAVVVLSPSAQLSQGDMVAFGIMVLSALVYTGAYFSLGVMVSSLTSRAFTSITVLISIWVLMTVGLPNVSPYIAQHLIPAPAIQEVEREKWAIGQEEDENRGVRGREYRTTTTDPPKVRGVVLSELWRDSFTNIARRQEEV